MKAAKPRRTNKLKAAHRTNSSVADRRLPMWSMRRRSRSSIIASPRVITRLRDTKRPERTRDLLAEDRNDPLAKFAGARTVVSVPILKHDELIGLIAIYRREVRPFADKQVEQVANFAAQAVIAIENARLLTETREALEKQTATAEVLGVINSSSGERAPVFEAIVKAPLCDAANSAVFRFDGSLIHLTAQYGLTAAQLDTLRDTFPLAPRPR